MVGIKYVAELGKEFMALDQYLHFSAIPIVRSNKNVAFIFLKILSYILLPSRNYYESVH